jgi:type II secretory ATPase GspE/PulE/Tfp pilus assembly ATPase PilB-like protein
VERDDVDMVLRGLRITAPEGMEPRLWRGEGCDACGGTGYRGRMGIYEIFSMGPQFHDPIARDLDLVKIQQLAKEAGMQTMFEDGIEKAMQGQTTIEEVVRVING